MKQLALRIFFIFCLSLCFGQMLAAQVLRPCGTVDCPEYHRIMQRADSSIRKEDFRYAIALLDAADYAAQRCGMNCLDTINRKIDSLFVEIAKKYAEAEALNKKNQKFIDNMLFYDNENKRFALAVKRERDGVKYGFVDANGDTLLGGFRFDKAQPFDEYDGFARVSVKKDDKEKKYLLDTFNRLYLLAESVAELNEETEALDLHGKALNRLPAEIKQHSALRVLLLYDNQIDSLAADAFRGLVNLQKLWLEYNKLAHLEAIIFQELRNLEELHLHDNLLTGLDKDIFKNLDNLRVLNLSENQITVLNKGSFYDLNKLQTLNLAKNPIYRIDTDIFASLIYLKYLNLSNVDICKSYPDDMKHLKNLKNLEKLILWDCGLYDKKDQEKVLQFVQSFSPNCKVDFVHCFGVFCDW